MGLWVGESGWQGGDGEGLWHLEKQLLKMEKTGGQLIFLSRFLSPFSPHKHNSWMLLNQTLEQEITLPDKLHLKSGQTVRNRLL